MRDTNADTKDADRKALHGLLGFAAGILSARGNVQLTMNSGLGVFHEHDVVTLPGVATNLADGTWLTVERRSETHPPEPPAHVRGFLASKGGDPAKPPVLLASMAVEVDVDEASDLQEAGLLRPENIHPLVEDDHEALYRVKVILLTEDCPQVRRDFEAWRRGAWSAWAMTERPVRLAISFYNALFRIHASMRSAESSALDLIWGIGIGRWQTGATLVDMPIIEQSVDLEIRESGAIAISPRNAAATVSLKPYLHLEVEGADRLLRMLEDLLANSLRAEAEFSPFSTSWEQILQVAAANITDTATHVTRQRLDEGARLAPADSRICITSSWALFARPRSSEARAQDLGALATAILRPNSPIPPAIRRLTAKPPDEAPAVGENWGILDSSLGALGMGQRVSDPLMPGLSGFGTKTSWTGAARDIPAPVGSGSRKVYFFPLPYNDEQSRIIEYLEQPDSDMVSVTGPPGTGKTHTIANIISHMIATGKRVLVTARTSEAISAVRDKLPESLRDLVIASVGSDREGAQQLRNAITTLSDQVMGLDKQATLERIAVLERDILRCEEVAEASDAKLTEIARMNLAPIRWQGQERSPMEALEMLNASADRHGWFTDRPRREAPAQIDEILERLLASLPTLGADLVYAGSTLPAPEDLPSTAELIAAHETEKAHRALPPIDRDSAPPMAHDSPDAEIQARFLLDDLRELNTALQALDPARKGILRSILPGRGVDRELIFDMCDALGDYRDLDKAAQVRFEIADCPESDFSAAVARGAAGQKPVGFSIFNGRLKAAIASVRVGDRAAATREDWRGVLVAVRLGSEAARLRETLEPAVARGLVAHVPQKPWDIAGFIQDSRSALFEVISLLDRIDPALSELARLFPYGFDHEALRSRLDPEPAIAALVANLPSGYQVPRAIRQLEEIIGSAHVARTGGALRDLSGDAESETPLFASLRELREAIGAPDTLPARIVAARSALTKEISRLTAIVPDLEQVCNDLRALERAGAPEWAQRLAAFPFDAPELIPADWRESWSWAEMKARCDEIVALGNGDAPRARKAEAMARRRKLLEELIRQRALHGLVPRMTSSVLSAMMVFTQAVSRIGRGTGKSAPKFRVEAQEASRIAASAVPVWIMPEYRIPEQLPPDLASFDLVILDEASQSDITSIAALARGAKVLIVGDEEQVSPAGIGIPTQKIDALRAQFLQGLPSSGLIDQNTSIFEIACRSCPERHLILREHFRCVAPIIQFSTRFYNNRLIPLRVPRASERFDPPLVDVYLPGATRQGKVNKSEAEYIVDEIAVILSDPNHAHRDIGVISLLGAEQADRIGRMLIEDPRIGPEQIEARRIIVGDARTLQGQERSVVFLSMVATPGNVVAQTSRSDRQRINVAMSRAADRLYLVRSVALTDLKPSDVKADILRHFIDPMPGGRFDPRRDLMERCESGFEREVLGMLIDANYRVMPQVRAGAFSIDLVVEGANDRRLAIELDGDAYHGPDVWARDMARQAMLERAGWIFWRVFGSQWRAQKTYWWRNLQETLDRLGIAPIGAAALDERFTEFRVKGALPTDRGPAAPTGETSTLRTATTAPAPHAAGEEPADRHRMPETCLTRGDGSDSQDDADGKVDAEQNDREAAALSEAREFPARILSSPQEIAVARSRTPDLAESPSPENGARGRAEPTGQGESLVSLAVPAGGETGEWRSPSDEPLPEDDPLKPIRGLADISPSTAQEPDGVASQMPELGTPEAVGAGSREGPSRAPTVVTSENPGSSESPIPDIPSLNLSRVEVGSRVWIETLDKTLEKRAIMLVEEADDPERGIIGVQTGLGAALMDAEIDDEVEFWSGDNLHKVRVVAIA